MIFRATRGKALACFRDLEEYGFQDYSGKADKRARTVYVIIFQEGPHIRERLLKICDSFMGKNFEIPTGMNQSDINERIY